MSNSWKNEHSRSFIQKKLAAVATSEILKNFRCFTKNFARIHTYKFLSYEASRALIFSEITTTLRLE